MTHTVADLFHDADPPSAIPAAQGWTDDRVEKLKTLYANGLSSSKIAAVLGGITRNGVIGKVHRLGLERRGAGWSDAPPREVRSRKPRLRVVRSNQSSGLRLIVAHDPAELAAMRCVEVEPRHLSLLDLEPKDCRFPYGDGPFTFCGLLKLDGSSYCPSHFALVRRQETKRRDGLPAKMPTNLADGRHSRAVFA